MASFLSKTFVIANGAAALIAPVALIAPAIVIIAVAVLTFVYVIVGMPPLKEPGGVLKRLQVNGIHIVGSVLVFSILNFAFPNWSQIPVLAQIGVLWLLVTSASILQGIVLPLLGHGVITTFADFVRRGIMALVIAYFGSLIIAYYLLPVNKAILPTVVMNSTTQGRVTGGLVAHADRYWYILVPAKPSGQVVMVEDANVRNVVIAH